MKTCQDFKVFEMGKNSKTNFYILKNRKSDKLETMTNTLKGLNTHTVAYLVLF